MIVKNRPRKILIGWLAVFAWPLVAIVLSDFSPFDQFTEYLFIKGGSFLTSSFLILPSLLIAVPLVLRLKFSLLSGESKKSRPGVERIVSSAILLAILTVFLWYYCLFASIAIEVNR